MARAKIAENTIFLTASGAASVFFTVVQLAILSRYLEGEQFGFFVSFRGFSLLLATGILLGLPQVLVRFLPTFAARGDSKRAISVFLGSAALVCVLGAVCHFSAGLWKEILPANMRSFPGWAGLVTWLVLASITLALKMLLYGAFNGLREMRMQMLLELLFLFLLTSYMLYARRWMDVEVLFEAMFVLNGAVFALGTAVYLNLARHLSAEAAIAVESVPAPNFFSYWMGSLALSIVALAFTDVDRFVVSSVLPMTAISVFHVASRVDVLIKRFLGLPVLAAQPEITRVYEEGRWSDITDNIGLFTKGLLVSALLSTALLAAIGRDVIVLLSGSSYEGAYRVFLFLLLSVPAAAISAPLLATMRSLHFMRWAVLCDFLWMVSYFGTFFFLASALGPEGMAISQVLASAVQLFAAAMLARKEGFFGGIGSNIGRLVIVLLPLAACCMYVTYRIPLYVSIVLVAFAPFGARYLLRWLRIFEPEEIGSILKLVTIPAGRRFASWILSAQVR